jgi:hypothetical protein
MTIEKVQLRSGKDESWKCARPKRYLHILIQLLEWVNAVFAVLQINTNKHGEFISEKERIRPIWPKRSVAA